MAFEFVALARDERDGVVKDFKAPNFAPGGLKGNPFMVFGFLTKQNENGVFYVDLTEKGAKRIVKLLTGAFVKKRPVHIVFNYSDRPAIP